MRGVRHEQGKLRCRVWRQSHVQVDENSNMLKYQGSLKDVLLLDLEGPEGGTVLLDRAETSGLPCTPNMTDVLRSMRYVNSVQVCSGWIRRCPLAL